MSNFNVGDTVVVTARIDNCGCEGIIESISDNPRWPPRWPIKVVFNEDTRDGDPYDLPLFNDWICCKQDDLELVKKASA